MPRCAVALRSLSEWRIRGMAGEQHGMCEYNTAARCKSNGKGTLLTLSGTAWLGNGMVTAWYVWIRIYAFTWTARYICMYVYTQFGLAHNSELRRTLRHVTNAKVYLKKAN
jgi:hypothetical protein